MDFRNATSNFRTSVLLILTLAVCHVLAGDAFAGPQGKLSRARNKTSSSAASQKKAPKREAAKKEKSRSEKKSNSMSGEIVSSIISSVSSSSRSSDSGKLASVSRNVRKDSPPKHENHQDRDRHDNHDRRDRDRDRHHGHDRNRNRRSFFRPSPFAFASFQSAPQVVHHTVIEREYVPVAVPAAMPVVDNRFAQPLPVQQLPSQSVGSEVFDQPLPPAIELQQFDVFHDWLTQIDLNVGSDFDGLDNAGLGLRVQVPESLGFDSDITYLRESAGSIRNHMWLGDWNLIYEPIVSRNFRFRFGAGFNWLNDSIGSEFGFNLTSSIDCRLSQNWMLQFEGDVGELGDADYSHGRVQLLRSFGKTSLALGYESYDIGGAKLNGAFTGLQFRF